MKSFTIMPRQRYEKRMCEAFSLRPLPEQRTFLEETACANKIGIGEAIREILDEAMKNTRD